MLFFYNKRWNLIDREYIQRDVYSVFLIMNSKSNLKETDRSECFKTYNKFKLKHNELIEKLKNNGMKNPSSFGIRKLKTEC